MNHDPMEAGIRERMGADGAPPLVIAAFLDNYRRWRAGDLGTIPAAALGPLGAFPRLEELDELEPAGEEAIARTVLIKLNGGLGTSMGLDQAKSLIIAKNGLSFLDIIVRQVEFLRRRSRAPLPLLLMNSFSTEVDSLAALAREHPGFGNAGGLPLSFRQHRVPKLDAQTGTSASWPDNPAHEWCPPGHADIYTRCKPPACWTGCWPPASAMPSCPTPTTWAPSCTWASSAIWPRAGSRS